MAGQALHRVVCGANDCAGAPATGEAPTRTYGTAERAFAGFVASIDIGVGSRANPDDEARALELDRVAAEGRLEALGPALRELYAHFATGRHRYTRGRAVLASTRDSRGDPATSPVVPLVVSLRMPADPVGTIELGGGSAEVMLDLHVSEALPAPHAEKLAADFALAQLDGGALDRARVTAQPMTPASLAKLEALLGLQVKPPNGGPQRALFEMLRLARESEPSLRVLAARMPGHALAQVLVAILDGASYGPEILTAVAALPRDAAATIIRIMVLGLDDAHWKGGLASIRAHVAAHANDERLRGWVESFAAR